MRHPAEQEAEFVKHVMIAEIKVASSGVLKATLGSCVALAVVNRLTGVCGLAHCLLAQAPPGTASNDARYVSEALPNLIRAVNGLPTARKHLRGFLAGGARMFHTSSERQTVGDLNVAAAREAFRESRIPFEEMDTGGMRGYSVILDCKTQSFFSNPIDSMATE